VLSFTVAALAMGRKEAPDKKANAPATATEIKTGVRGRVEVWQGNFMPMVEPSKTRGQITPGINRRVRLHEPVRMNEGTAGVQKDSIRTPLIAEAVTDSTGLFFIPALPGNYSIFVDNEGGWYYNGFDGKGVQGAVTVWPDSVSEILIKITGKATF